MPPNPKRLLIEGWRGIPHSYALVNQFQMLQFLSRPDLTIAHRDLAYILPQWKPQTGLFSPDQERQLALTPSPRPGEQFDAVYRIAAPYDLRASQYSPRTVVFGTAEFGMVPAHFMFARRPLAEAHADSQTIVVTPSNWSREGFIRSGAAPDRVVIVPHGIDPQIFSPPEKSRRTEARRALNWEGFIFLTVGSATENKGIDLLLKALAAVSKTHPQTRLVVKGLDDLYDSRRLIQQAAARLTPQEVAQVENRIHYRGEVGTLADMATLYQLADAYVAPYRAEGFGLPILEAAACALPVICTAGGPSDDFLRDDFALRVQSEITHLPCYGEPGMQLEPNLDHLIQLMRQVIEKPESISPTAGSEFIRGNYTWKHAVDKLLPVLFPQT